VRTRGPVAVLRGSMFPKLRACASVYAQYTAAQAASLKPL
jgi:hypothetical protein